MQQKFILLVALLSVSSTLGSEVSMRGAVNAKSFIANSIGSDMVLQRNEYASLFGWTKPGSSVKVLLDGKSAADAVADGDGRWKASLPPQKEGDGHTITIKDEDHEEVLKNVAFGDVWLCSGQSNMSFQLKDAFGGPDEVKTADKLSQMRVLQVKRTESPDALSDITPSMRWGQPDPKTIGGFSAVCFFFGKSLLEADSAVPIGLIQADWGGTPVEAWSSPAVVDKCKKKSNEIVVDTSISLGNPHSPSVLFNGMIHPLLDLRVFGAIWYQGEANANNPKGYECYFPAMIQDWRDRFDAQLPFFYVELAAFSNPNWPEIREAQKSALKLDKTGFATAMDLGDPKSPRGAIHPRNKSEVGRRLALAARHTAYDDETVVWFGPSNAKVQQADDCHTLDLSFAPAVLADNVHMDGTESCSTCCNDAPFEVQYKTGGDWDVVSSATPSANSVRLQVAKGKECPIAVRYAWTSFAQCALYNSQQLPASQFHVDIAKTTSVVVASDLS